MRAVALSIVALAACQPGRSAVFITVGAEPPVAGVHSLRVVVEKDGRTSQPESLAMPDGVDAIPPEQTFTLTLGRDHDGAALLRVAALDGDGTSIGEGSAPIELRPGEPTSARVTLGVDVALSNPDGGADDMRRGGVTVSGVARLIGLADHGGVTATLTPGGYTTTTQSDGSYSFANVPTGTYTLTFEKGAYWERVPDFQVTTAGNGLSTDGGLFPITPLEIPRATRLVTTPTPMSHDARKLTNNEWLVLGRSSFMAPGRLYLTREREAPLSIADQVLWSAVDASYDGSKIIYSTVETNVNGELYFFDRTTGTRRKLADNVSEARLILGGWVVYLGDYDTATNTQSLKRIALDGTSIATLATGVNGSFDREIIFGYDGQTLFYLDNKVIKRALPIAGTAAEALATTLERTIADVFTNVGPASYFVDATDPNNRSLKYIASPQAMPIIVASAVRSFTVTPNGTLVVEHKCSASTCTLGFNNGGALRDIDTSTTGIENFDGIVSYTTQSPNALKTLDLSTGAVLTVATDCTNRREISRDKRRVICDAGQSLKVGNWDGSGSVVVGTTATRFGMAVFSPNGQFVAYTTTRAGSGSGANEDAAFVSASTGGTPTPVHSDCTYVQFATSARVVVSCLGTSGVALSRFDLPTGPIVTIEDGLAGYNGYLGEQLSPDGEWVVYDGTPFGATTRILKVARVAGGAPVVLGSNSGWITFLGATGSRLFYRVNSANGAADSRIRDLSTGAETMFGRTQTGVPRPTDQYIDLLSDGPNLTGTLTIYDSIAQTFVTAISGVRYDFSRRGDVVVATKKEGGFDFQKGGYLIPPP